MTWLGMPADEEEAGKRRPSFRAFVRRRIEAELLAPGPGVSVAWQDALHRGLVLHDDRAASLPALDQAQSRGHAGRALCRGSRPGAVASTSLQRRRRPLWHQSLAARGSGSRDQGHVG